MIAQPCNFEIVGLERRLLLTRWCLIASCEDFVRKVSGMRSEVYAARSEGSEPEPHGLRVLNGDQVHDQIEAVRADVDQKRRRILSVYGGAQIAIQFALEYGGFVFVPHQHYQAARMIHTVQDPGSDLPGALSDAQKRSGCLGRCECSGQVPYFR